MKIGCVCGETIYDNSDYLTNKARLISDQDTEDFTEALQVFRIDPYQAFEAHVAAIVYQCTACGRLLLERDSTIYWFTPEDPVQNVLHSAKGENWPRPLVAHWRNGKGEIFWGSSGLADGDNAYITDIGTWEELESLYHSVFNRLLGKKCLRSAFLDRNGELIHEWG